MPLIVSMLNTTLFQSNGAVSDGMRGGYAADDGVALHFRGTRLLRAVSSCPQAGAYRVSLSAGRIRETRVEVHHTHTPDFRDQVQRREELLRRLIEKLNQTHKNVVGLLVPAITLGCVEFKEIDPEGNYVFERNHRDFEPREVDQPLRYALSFALNHVNNNRWWWESLVRVLTGRGKAFGQALKDFYSQRNGSYKTYGNPELLGVK